MKLSKLNLAVATVLLTAASLSHATYVDLSTPTVTVTGGATVELSPTSVTINTPAYARGGASSPRPPSAGLTYNNVTNVLSFEYNSSSATIIPQLITSVGSEMLGSTSGFTTYTFSSPYTGSLTFNYGPIRTASAGTFIFRNMATVSAVPEPETSAMVLAGLGVMGAIARRRKSSVRPA